MSEQSCKYYMPVIEVVEGYDDDGKHYRYEHKYKADITKLIEENPDSIVLEYDEED